MPYSVASKAVDFFLAASSSASREGKNRAIIFYGGEPLLRFDLIKEVVELTKKKGAFEQYRFSLTGVQGSETLRHFLLLQQKLHPVVAFCLTLSVNSLALTPKALIIKGGNFFMLLAPILHEIGTSARNTMIRNDTKELTCLKS
jgi:hypothetical protein